MIDLVDRLDVTIGAPSGATPHGQVRSRLHVALETVENEF
jgi:hypothetical protein